jgi:sialate O-acetylesterase
MIVQRDVPLKIWGWASPGEKITVTIGKRRLTTQTTGDGKWSVAFPALKSGAPYKITIAGKNEITLNNVLAGDVWVCAGQSNMVHYLQLHRERYQKDIAQASFHEIRQFLIPTTVDLLSPHQDFSGGQWKTATQANIGRFSVVAYFFAKKLYEKYHVPIGIINASVGGTPIEAWMSEENLSGFSEVTKMIQQNKDTAQVNRTNAVAKASNIGREKRIKQDRGLSPSPWYDLSYVPKAWNPIMVPGYWEDQGIKDLDGIIWYRKEFELPSAATAAKARLLLGRIVDADEVYVNGKFVGGTTYQYPQRRYNLPDGILKPGRNIIIVRVINYSGKGGFVPDKPYRLIVGEQEIDLRGEWHYKVGQAFTQNDQPLPGISLQNQPTALFNGMIAPLENFSVKGIVWYQGESNTANPEAYHQLLPALISGWRKHWNKNAMPFVYAQLPNFMDVNYVPAESHWAELREAQRRALVVPSTGMAVTIDLGEWNDIHPGNKQPVGERLALAAQRVAYSDITTVSSGPLYREYTIEGDKMIVTFDHVGGGLISADGEPIAHFDIAGSDGKFFRAQAVIRGGRIEVWSDEVSSPIYVRYAWADNPQGANLYNKEGLPASPFRTDR